MKMRKYIANYGTVYDSRKELRHTFDRYSLFEYRKVFAAVSDQGHGYDVPFVTSARVRKIT
jgi:hypothetical protein